MKKLIAMIGAVAMSFCAFAATTVTPGISFEAEEPGVDNTAKTFTPGEKWGWESDPLELGAYVTGEPGVYDAEGPKARRGDEFPKKGTNANYLKLDTGTADLTREMDADAGKGYVDQLVKFTGFEEPQTNLTAGIGVWMSEFVTNDTDEAATTDLTETNLYVTVGMGSERIALKIDDDYELDRWYRLTIKPLGDVFGGADGTTPREGFLVYINGTQVGSSDERATVLIDNPSKMTKAAKDAMAAGQLFTAINTGAAAAHTTVGYKGVGAIDDIILTDVAPAFTVTTVDVTFAPITGAIIAKVEDADGNEFDYPTGAISVKQGDLTVTLEAALGYKMKGTGEYVINTDKAVGGVLTVPVQEGDFAVVVATVTNGSGTVSYAEAELFTAFAALTAGDQVAILKVCSVTNGEGAALYSFMTSNTTINVVADGWDVFVGIDEEGVAPGMLMSAEDIAVGKTLAVTFEDGLMGSYGFSGAAVNGQLIVTNGLAMTMEGVTVGDGALIKAANLTPGASITLSGTGKVMSETQLVYSGDEKVFTNDDIEEIAPVAPDTYYTYQIASEPPPADPIVTVTVNGVPTNYQTVGEALQAVWNAEGTQSYPIEVEAIADAGLAITNEDRVAQIAKGVTIEINRGSWAFSGALAYKGRIDGAVSATDVSIIAGGSITLGANGLVTVNDTTTLTTSDFSADTGYKVIVEEGEGTKTFKTQKDSPTPTGKPGISFEETEEGVNGLSFTPGARWTWDDEPLEIGNYAGENLPYGDAGTPTARRDDQFARLSVNNNYLKLDTGTNELVCAMDAQNGYVDQLMKFTGYEDIQTNFAADTKIAVWMGEICTNEETEATATNLYITVGKVAGGTVEQVALKIDGDYSLDTWYRLTVKPLGDIYKGAATTTPRAGFAVYINGTQVRSSDPVAMTLVDNANKLDPDAAALMVNGQLFTAIDSTSVNFNEVAYNGIGAIDDIILTADRPAFIDGGADCTFTIAPPTGLYVVSVKNGNTELHPPYSVPAGTSVTITFGALPGWKITGNNSIQRTINTDGQEITLDEGEIEFATVAAIIVDSTGATTNEYAEAELYAAFAALTPGDQVAIVMACSVTNGEGAALYSFMTSNTTINVVADGWDVFVGIDEEGVAPGMLMSAEDIAVGKTLAVTFEDGLAGSYGFSGAAVNGQLIVTNGLAMIMEEVTVGDGALIKAANLTLGASVTLSGTGKVMTKSNELLAYFLPADEVEVSEQPDADGYYTYQIAAAPGTFKVTVPELVNFTVAVTNGETEVGTTNGVYTFNYASNVKVAFAAAEGYEITKDTSTNIVSLVENVMIEAPTVAIKTFNVTFKPENGSADIVSNDVAYGTAFANVKPADPTKEHFSFKGWEPASETVIISNTTYTAQWLEDAKYTVTFSTNKTEMVDKKLENVYTGTTLTAGQIPELPAGATWDVNPTNAVITCNTNFNATIAAPIVPVKPGEDITPAPGDTKEKINSDDTTKAKYLKGPDGFTADATYRSYFDAVDGSAEGTIKFELNDTGKAALQENANGEIIKIKPDEIAALTDGSMKAFTISVENQLPGFYYAVKQGNGIGNMKIVEAGVLATGKAAVQLNFTKYNGAGFYKIVVSEKPIVPEN